MSRRNLSPGLYLTEFQADFILGLGARPDFDRMGNNPKLTKSGPVTVKWYDVDGTLHLNTVGMYHGIDHEVLT